MTVVYDSSTKWVTQYHATKTVTDIDATQVKEGDRVICKGTWEKKGTFRATLISKRLSHPAKICREQHLRGNRSGWLGHETRRHAQVAIRQALSG